ncbi:hypothetical protein WG908_06180 [Sphingobium sp. AN641]|uniref:hypothetical protein n=1 Tax=Sphingobium sp. AN641 TaxID=3133443 RepID=UPI0030C23DE5
MVDGVYFKAGLDQQTGRQLDKLAWLGQPLANLITSAEVPKSHISDVARRVEDGQ